MFDEVVARFDLRRVQRLRRVSRWVVGVGVLLAVGIALPPPAIAADDTPAVLMQHNGVAVTAQDVRRYVHLMIPESQRRQALSRPDTVRKVMAQIYISRQLARRAEQTGIANEPDVEWFVNMESAQALGGEYMERQVAEQLADVDWELAAREQYRANPDEYGQKAKVNAAHVLIRTNERSEKKAKALAEEVREKALGGADFTQLVEEYSEGPSAKKGGEVGFFTRSEVAPAFAKAAFSLGEPGDISDVVKTQFGYHVIRLIERRPATTPPFEQVRARIIASIKKDRRARVRGAILTEIRSAEGIEVNQQAIGALEDELRVPGPGGQDGNN